MENVEHYYYADYCLCTGNGTFARFCYFDSEIRSRTFWLAGYKLYDIICFDWLFLTKWKIPQKIYPETAGAKGYDSFGFNTKSQIIKLFVFAGISLLVAAIISRL
ncbi:MAG: hypothetical protein J6X67_07905 [Treponema sp.]|nr:hypothetical protein [Treponema sp.]